MKKIILFLLVSAVTLSARNSRLSLETSNVISTKSHLSFSEVDKNFGYYTYAKISAPSLA